MKTWLQEVFHPLPFCLGKRCVWVCDNHTHLEFTKLRMHNLHAEHNRDKDITEPLGKLEATIEPRH